MATMRAVVFHGPGEVHVEEVPKPSKLEPDEVLVRVEKSAICGTDLHPYEGHLDLEPGVILGHEFLGTVEEVGSAVQLVEPGDRTVASCVVNCGHCRNCRRGQPGTCVGIRFYGYGMAFGDVAGAQAEYVVVPAADIGLRKLPEETRGEQEDFLFAGDIMTTGYEAVRRAIRPGDSVAVVGAGPVGQCAVMAANALGAGKVIIVDKVASRLKEAAAFGAIPVNADEDDPTDAVLDLTDWAGADVVVDAVGHESALLTACTLVRSGGAITIPGLYNQESIALPFGDLWLKGVSIHTGATNFATYMDEVIALIGEGKLTPSQIISHRLPLTEAEEAYRLFAAREATKVVFEPAA